jgi:putative ATPase
LENLVVKSPKLGYHGSDGVQTETQEKEGLWMDLFEYMRGLRQETDAPLASRIRPRTLDEVVGQEHIIAKDKLLYRAITADKLRSILFYGPPGTGKTTLAKVIANTTSSEFRQINATSA